MGEEIVSLEEIHYQFWNEFVNKVFNDSEFKNDFNYRKSWNKSYYDLFWGNKDLHLCVRHNIKESYVSVEIYITENEEVFNYLQTNKNEIEKLYGKKLTFTKAKGKVGKAKKIYDVYMDGETSEKNNWSNYIKWIRDTALKMKKIVEIFYKNLDKDINFNEITYEREVISIPAADTINLIYKYGIHAHPNDYNRYPYKKSLFYTFREKNGVMTKLYELNTTIILNPNKISEIDSLDVDIFIKERLKNYINERENKFSFDDKESEYKFYILNNPIELVNEIALPNQNNQSYFTIEEVFSGKRYVDRCNYKTNNTREDLINIIKDKSKVDYLEINVEDFDSNIEIEEGKTITKLVEVKKRNSLARKLKLEEFKSINGKLYCEVCGIDDEIVLDVHHDKVSVANMKEGYITKLEDLRLICENCHRKVHGLKVTVDRLIEINKGINFK